MKKLFALLAVVLAVVSCQKDADLGVNVGGEQLVNITVALPEATRAASDSGFDLSTLAHADSNYELRYILEIYVDGNTENCIRQELFTNATENVVVFPVRLVPQRNYRVVAWADIVKKGEDTDLYYDTQKGLDEVTIIENKWNAMDEYRDAYTAYKVVNNFTANTAIDLTLKRPFAKLRVVSTDIKNIEDLGYTLVNGMVEYSVDLKREFNALYGTANAASYKRHSLDYPTPYDDKANKNSRTLFADYIFVNNIEEQDAVQFTLSVYENGGLLKTTTFNTDIALRANTLTTIIGEVLTEGGNVQIKIDGELNEGPDYTVVSSASHLLKVINAGGEYILGNDIIVTEADAAEAEGIITRSAGEAKTTTINLNGKTITIINKSNEPLVTVPAGNTLTFTDNTNTGSIVLAEDSTESFIKNEGTVILEAGEINNHEDNDVPVIDGKIVIDGATVNDNKVEESDKLDNAAWLADVLANGGTYVFTEDMTSSEKIVVTAKNPVVLDGNGKTLTSTADRAINVSGAEDVTIKNLNIVASGERAINVIQNSQKVTIENVTATAANYTVNVASSAPGAVVAIKNSTLNGLCTVNVSAVGTEVTVDGSTVNCNDNDTTEGEAYAALSLNTEAVGGKIIATNTTINVAEGSDSLVARNGAENGVVTIDGSDEDVAVMYAIITYPGPYYHSFATIAKAVEFAKSGDKISLIRNVELTEPLVIAEDDNVVINVNGKTITTTEKQAGRHHYAIDNYGTLTLEGEGAINARGVENFGTMTINGDITITNVDTNGGSAIWNEGNLVINGGTFTTNTEAGEGSYGSALNTQVDGSAVINGGNFIANSQLTYAILNYGETVINNATVKGKHGAVGSVSGAAYKTTIYGGSFELMENPGVSDHCTYYVSAIYGGTFSLGNNTDSGAKVFYESNIADGYKAIEIPENKYMVVAEDVNGYLNSEVTNQKGVEYEGEFFENKITNALWFNNYIFGGDAAIKVENKTYGAIIMENCSGDFKNDVITINNDNNSVMILANLNLTIAEGKKLIKSTNTIYQVFMTNITINGEEMTNETIAKYLENVGWYQVVEEI